MARDSKIEVCAINIRIHDKSRRDYNDLISSIAKIRRGIRVYGDSYVAISFYDPKAKIGLLSKYTEIDLDGEWFDLDDFEAAAPEKIEEINIPENLRPNHAAFFFKLDVDLHIVAFSIYAESKSLSARSVGKYFDEILRHRSIVKKFGNVDSDIVKSYDEVERILTLPHLKELEISIGLPNSDDLGEGLAEIIERRLKEQNADIYEETLKARGRNDIEPNERTKNLAQVAAENGHVRAKALVNGILVPQDTDERPLTERVTYKPELRSERTVFQELAGKIFERISSMRASLK